MSAHYSSKYAKLGAALVGDHETSKDDEIGQTVQIRNKKCSKFGPLLVRLRQLLQVQRDELEECTRAVLEVAGDAQVVRDELAASLVLSR